MIEVFSTNDPIQLSFVEAVLKDAGVKPIILDASTAGVFGGSLPWIQRRVMVADHHEKDARQALRDALEDYTS